MRQVGARTWRSRAEWYEVCFTIDQARRALPYVRRVLSDATEAYHDVQAARRKLAKGPVDPLRSQLTFERDRALRRLNRTIDECHALGVEHLDIPNAMIAFRAAINGRLVCLIWRLGDSTVDPWGEWHGSIEGESSDNEARDAGERRSRLALSSASRY